MVRSVSTDGTEDSVFVSPDGSKMYFTYMRLDWVLWSGTGKVRLPAPARTQWPQYEPFNTYGAQIYSATRTDSGWSVPANIGSPVNDMAEMTGGVWVSQDDQRMLFVSWTGGPSRPAGIYYAEKSGGVWDTPVLASSAGWPFGPGDDNPHLTLDEKVLFFESSPGGQKDIWMAERNPDGTWKPAVALPPTVNTQWTEGSPFSLDGKTLYFDDKGFSGIYRTVRNTDGSWSPRQQVIAGNCGDPALTLSDDLYFTAVTPVRDAAGTTVGYDANLMVAAKK